MRGIRGKVLGCLLTKTVFENVIINSIKQITLLIYLETYRIWVDLHIVSQQEITSTHQFK